MTLSKLTLAVATILGASVTTSAFAIELYVDTKTKQIYAEPGPHRQKMGTFERVEDAAAKAPVVVKPDESTKAELAEIHHDLELKTNELKALEENVIATREAKAKNDEKWFNKINLRGYTQLRYNLPLSGDRIAGDPELKSVGDSSIKDNSGFSFRRVRLVFSGDVNEYVSLYIQPDFASNVSDSQQNFAQLRDAYADIAFDKAHEYRIRAGQSKVPFGWENLQSSQNRIALDRDDALNSAVPSERDLGLFAYWSPSDVQSLWKKLAAKGLKTSGDYGVAGIGVYNGQGLNRAETNDDLYAVAHTTYPVELNFLGYPFTGQVVEIGADAISGYFNPTTGASNVFGRTTGNQIAVSTATVKGVDSSKRIREDRVAVHAVLFPQPFGLQAEWNWGEGATLNPTANSGRGAIESQGLSGGYVQAMYKIDNVFRADGVLIPYVKWQTFDGAWKGATNSPNVSVDEIEAGVEYQIMKALEVTLAYATMDRTNTSTSTSATSQYLGQASGDLMRMQLQWNY
ncbi:MAG: porin [Methylococcaceae bacterium]|nr:porin [Methylococcaceae bacterium]MDZ4156277.1 porin [Methylococcales bacterium]MDP2393411.1 porin [Methylococcaceae bacterium]MDP3019882.1 porin [Methylococcaceae bacterium]MDP3389513.1 porin [Methylococcaceae bacterium]